MNVVPVLAPSVSVSNVIVPPAASTARLTTAKPSPMPLDFVENEGWKIFSRASGGTPEPVSATTATAHRVPSAPGA